MRKQENFSLQQIYAKRCNSPESLINQISTFLRGSAVVDGDADGKIEEIVEGE
jgi:hypothetical protein